MKNLLIILQADTTALVESSSSAWDFWKWVLLCVALIYTFRKIRKANKAKIKALEEAKTKEKAELLRQLYKDKSAPFFRVKGISFYEPKKPGCYICKLIPNPNNPHDPHAIRIEHPTLGMMGHIPKGNTYLFELAKKKEIYGAVEIGSWNDGEQYGKFWLDDAYFTMEDIAQLVDINAQNI